MSDSEYAERLWWTLGLCWAVGVAGLVWQFFPIGNAVVTFILAVLCGSFMYFAFWMLGRLSK